jgi:hypothetical protein
MFRIALVICALIVSTAAAHDSHATYETGTAVVVNFADHDGAAAEGWTYTVIDPDGEAFARGMCDARGRVLFMPDRPGAWRVRVFSPDGHGASVDVVVDEDLATEVAAPTGERSPWTTWVVVVVAALALLGLVGRLRR